MILQHRHRLTYETIGQHIEALRTERGWSQRELARRCGAKVDGKAIQKAEVGDSLGLMLAFDIADALGVRLDDLRPGGKT